MSATYGSHFLHSYDVLRDHHAFGFLNGDCFFIVLEVIVVAFLVAFMGVNLLRIVILITVLYIRCTCLFVQQNSMHLCHSQQMRLSLIPDMFKLKICNLF